MRYTIKKLESTSTPGKFKWFWRKAENGKGQFKTVREARRAAGQANKKEKKR